MIPCSTTRRVHASTISLVVSIMMISATTAQTRVAPPSQKPGATHRPSTDPLQEVESLIQNGKIPEAEQKLQPLMADQAKNPQAWFDLGYIESHLDKLPEAIAAYRKAVELQPDWFEANLNLGIDLDKAGHAAESATVLTHAVELKPVSGGNQSLHRAWFSLARVLEPTDLLGSAKAYDKAAELAPPDLFSVIQAGIILERAGDLAGAEEHYIKGANTGDPGALARLIDLLNHQKRFADSEQWLRKYIQLKPHDCSAISLLGKALISEGRAKEAIALLRPESVPVSCPFNQPLAAAYMDDKQYAAAIPLLQEEVQRAPSDAGLHMRLGYALLHELKYAEAESELLKTVQLKPSLAEAYGYLADAARQNKHYELCVRALDARSKLLPETPGTYFLRATAYDELHMLKPAVANYKQFLAVAEGKYPDQEFQARHRLKALEH